MDYFSEIIRSFREIKRTYHNIIQKDADSVGVTAVQLIVLQILLKNERISLGELSERLKMTNSSLSGVVERLVQANLIVRERLKQDRRTLTLALTPEGERIVQIATGPNSQLYKMKNRIMELPEDDIKNLLRIYGEILNKLNSGEVGEDD